MKTQLYPKLLLYVVLCCTLVVGLGLMAGCKGSNGSNGANGAPGINGTNGTNLSSVLTYTTGIDSVTFSPVSNGTVTATINFHVQYINPLTGTPDGEILGLDAPDTATPANLGHLRFNMAKLLPGVATNSTGSTPNSWWAVGSSENAVARLVNNGGGLYTYTTAGIVTTGLTPTYNFYDSTRYTRFVLMVQPKDQRGAGVTVSPIPIELGEAAKLDITNGSTVSQDVVPTAQCLNCHATFGDPRLNPLAFHPDEGRVETFACVVCHYENNFTMDLASVVSGSTYTFPFGEGALGTWIHKIHTAQIISSFSTFSTIEYPQDIRNCTTCHSGGVNSDNWQTEPCAKACLSCHNPNYILDPVIAAMTPLTSPTTTHPGGQIGPIGSGATDDTKCKSCHSAAAIAGYHETYFATTHNPIATEPTISFMISGLTVSSLTSAPVITFSVLANGTPVTLNASGGFVVSGTTFTTTNLPAGDHPQVPAFLFAYAVPQDGITNPSDWNNRAEGFSVNLSTLTSGTPNVLTQNANGSYTAIVSASTFSVPADATMLTAALCGIFEDTTTGVNIAGRASVMTASGYTKRRQIVSDANCDKCHEQLGDPTVQYSIHEGAYVVQMCAMCHTPDLAGSNGWSASFRVWYHALHADTIRNVPFEVAFGFPSIAYPGVLSNCEQCHMPGTYDFSASQYTPSLIANFLLVTDVTGTPAASVNNAPYFVANGVNYYGIGATVTFGTATDDPLNLVSSPIAAVCTACHDGSDEIAHIVENGGAFYVPRSVALANAAATSNLGESCLVCHGPGAIESIQGAHNSLIIQNQ